MVGVTSALIWGRSTVIEPLVGIYAFQPDTTTSRPSHQSLIKATTQLIALINSPVTCFECHRSTRRTIHG